jgi:hypothetical protein
MTAGEQQTPAQRMIGDFMPKMVTLTDDVLFGDVGHILEGTIEPGKVFDQTVDLDGVPDGY